MNSLRLLYKPLRKEDLKVARHLTFSEVRWPNDPAYADQAARWARSVANQVLEWTWRAFDILQIDHLAGVDLAQPLEQLERDLTYLHFIEIQIVFSEETDGYPSFVPHHEPPEMETRSSSAAKPPAYDLAFVSTANRRWLWPLEAKVVSSEKSLSAYLRDVNDKFLGCIAAPFVGEGAMIAYLLTNEISATFQNLAHRLGQPLEPVPEFQSRPHRVSSHTRATAPDLRLHHMLMQCIASQHVLDDD